MKLSPTPRPRALATAIGRRDLGDPIFGEIERGGSVVKHIEKIECEKRFAAISADGHRADQDVGPRAVIGKRARPKRERNVISISILDDASPFVTLRARFCRLHFARVSVPQ